jgi:propanol-preferring alcohol dehydrogenase
MAKTMKAAVARAFGEPLAIEEVPIPSPEPGEVLVKIVATGVCHTDLHAADGDWPVKPVPPFMPGHEGAGVVAAIGTGVTQLKEGDPVGIAWLHDACGRCEHCITGWETLCENQHDSGYSVNGSFAEYAIGSAAYVGRTSRSPVWRDLAALLLVLGIVVLLAVGAHQMVALFIAAHPPQISLSPAVLPLHPSVR